MTILSKKKSLRTVLKISIEQDVLDEVKKYCQFAGENLESMDDFFNEAAKFVFSKDSAWKKHKKTSKK